MWLDAIDRQNYIHASIQATLHNAHFDSKGVPWTAEDLLGRGDREARKTERLKDRLVSFRQTAFADTSGPEALPDWALQLTENRKRVN